MRILVTGGCGYIGSHIVVRLLESGFKVVIVDSLVNGSMEVIGRIERITGLKPVFVLGDIRDRSILKHILSEFSIDAVVHCAGLKSVAESRTDPIAYYDNNVMGAVSLIQAMSHAGVKRLIFSSSATVYGCNSSVPYVESDLRGIPTSAYGASKAMVEQILEDLVGSDPEWIISSLRYFNPVGAHPTGLIGEDPKGVPNNLAPYLAQVAVGRREKLLVFGGDYPTVDGTCRRDYLHVMDLAEGHLAALNYTTCGFNAFNLGTGNPLSVLQMVKIFEKVSGVTISYEIVGRRPGDLPEFWANPEAAYTHLGWSANRGVEQMVRDAWRWQLSNPHGYV
jgi:UDP-glucose 4-epimerase